MVFFLLNDLMDLNFLLIYSLLNNLLLLIDFLNFFLFIDFFNNLMMASRLGYYDFFFLVNNLRC
jgi:hypothetical protein